MTEAQVNMAELWVAALGLALTLTAALIAWRTFLRTERWKRAEFIAGEMKQFFDNPLVQRALWMIDWGTRSIPLLDEHAENRGRVMVTRPMQIHALLPHPLVSPGEGSDQAEAQGSPTSRFTPEEVAIRDCYDALLDRLERFADYVRTELISVGELRPYLEYWIKDIHAPTEDAEDAAWAAVLLTYIEFYGFSGVQTLFRQFECPIDPSESGYQKFLRQMKDQNLALGLAGQVRVKYPGPPSPG